MISLTNITKSYASEKVLQNLNLTIAQGEYVAIMGSSGSGKSTLMNIIGTLEKPDSGEYFFLDNKVHHMSKRKLSLLRNNHIGFVFQSFQLIPNQSVYQNVLLPLIYKRKWVLNKKKHVQKALQLVGVEGKLHQKPQQLSGGQKQRVAIARAIINEPSLLLADEPTGSLDEATTEVILQLFDFLHQRGATIVMITHDAEVAKRAQRVLLLKDGALREYKL